MSLYYFYCNNTQRHLQGLGAMVSNTLHEAMGKQDVLLGDVLQSMCRQAATGEWEVSPSFSYLCFFVGSLRQNHSSLFQDCFSS